jgi:hypothetical protein
MRKTKKPKKKWFSNILAKTLDEILNGDDARVSPTSSSPIRADQESKRSGISPLGSVDSSIPVAAESHKGTILDSDEVQTRASFRDEVDESLSVMFQDNSFSSAKVTVDFSENTRKCYISVHKYSCRLSDTSNSIEYGKYLEFVFDADDSDKCMEMLTNIVSRFCTSGDGAIDNLSVHLGFRTQISTLFDIVDHCTLMGLNVKMYYMREEITLL